MKSKSIQLSLIRRESKSYGGVLLNTRKGRSHGRPLDTKNTMHLVLRSSRAVGEWSFKRPAHELTIQKIVKKFSEKHGIKILSLANVGNHLHFHIKITNRYSYKSFIRAITSGIAMCVTGTSRWNPLKKEAKDKFWDYRPFTRVILGFRALLNLRDYLEINELEGLGYKRLQARFIIAGFENQSRTRLRTASNGGP